MSYTLYDQQNTEVRKAVSLMNGNALAHFRLRSSNWAMAAINTAIGILMTINPGMLTDNPGANIYFAHLVSWISPDGWRLLFVGIGFVRLAALYINGSFPSIWWTPHVRLIMAFLSFAVWIQFAFALAASGILTIGTVLYFAVVVVEGYNIAVAASETKHRAGGDLG